MIMKIKMKIEEWDRKEEEVFKTEKNSQKKTGRKGEKQKAVKRDYEKKVKERRGIKEKNV